MKMDFSNNFTRDSMYTNKGDTHNDYTPPTFEEKVRSMSSSEIIMAMVQALTRPPIINIDMYTYGGIRKEVKKYFFGLIKKEKEICYGCAATNTICKISGKTFSAGNIGSSLSRSLLVNADEYFLCKFEAAINCLRKADITGYNYYAEGAQFAKINVHTSLPCLLNDYTNDHLESYKKLAELQLNFEKYDKTREEPNLQDCTL